MNSYKQYFPNYFDDFTSVSFEFKNLDDFLNNEYIKKIVRLGFFYKFYTFTAPQSDLNCLINLIAVFKINDKYENMFLGTLKEDIPELDRWTSEDMKKIDE